VFLVGFWFLCGVSGAVGVWFSALSMLSEVTFIVVERHVSDGLCAVWMLALVGSAGGVISEGGGKSL